MRFTKKEIKQNLEDWEGCLEERKTRLKQALLYHNTGIIKYSEVLRIKRLVSSAEHAVKVFSDLLKQFKKSIS